MPNLMRIKGGRNIFGAHKFNINSKCNMATASISSNNSQIEGSGDSNSCDNNIHINQPLTYTPPPPPPPSSSSSSSVRKSQLNPVPSSRVIPRVRKPPVVLSKLEVLSLTESIHFFECKKCVFLVFFWLFLECVFMLLLRVVNHSLKIPTS